MRSRKIFLTLFIIAAAVGLSACSNSADTSEASSSVQALEQASSADEAHAETTALPSSADSSDEEKVYTLTITAEVTDYSDRQLTFLYEGESYTLPIKRENFKNDFPPLKWVKLYSEQILNNKLGKSVTAKLLVNNDITSIISCDIIGQNGYEFNGEGFKLTRTEGSMCELSKDGEIIEADLNDLVISEKCDYPKEIEGVSFAGYRFTDGGFILHSLYLPDDSEHDVINIRELNSFFGTVQGLEDGRAAVLLTDEKTICTVPTYYCERELSAGDRVMLILDCDTDIFGSGDELKFDYAVILTDSDYFHTGREFEELAYARSDPYELGGFIFTAKEQTE